MYKSELGTHTEERLEGDASEFKGGEDGDFGKSRGVVMLMLQELLWLRRLL